MNYQEFLSTYSTDFLSNIDVEIHNHMLNKFLIQNKKIDQLTFFDIGCNAGSFIKVVKQKGINAKLHAFEPHPYLFKYLNETYPNEKINQKCVSDKNGKIVIHIPSISVGISSIINRPVFQDLNQEIRQVETDSITFDSYMEENGIEHVDFVKIDVEGAEYFVFDGARNALKQHKITCGQFEIGIDESGYNLDDITNLLNEYGYEVEKIFQNDCFFYLKS